MTGSLEISSLSSPFAVTGTGMRGADSECDESETQTYYGTLVPGATLSLTAYDESPINPTTVVTTDWVFNPIYDQPSSFTAIAGTWVNADGSTLNIDTGGLMSVTNLPPDPATTGCVVTGAVSLIDPNYNLYAYSMTWNNCPGGGLEHGLFITALVAIDATVSPTQLIGGGLQTDGEGGAANVPISAVLQ
jgi:hypothetical protein